jgi:NifU-like protein involved in Fe-S cluster formation
MACVENVLRESGYSSKAIDLYLNKVNVGTCDDTNMCFGYTGPCGDTMEIFLHVDINRIRDAKFQAIGCEGAFICGSAITEMIKGMTMDQVENIEKDQVIAYLGGLPEEKYDCACLAVTTLRKTLQKFKKRQS